MRDLRPRTSITSSFFSASWSFSSGNCSSHQFITRSLLEKKRWPPMSMRLPLYCTVREIQPIVIERFDYMGGISRTVQYKGNRMDIGGHRFFSKSDRVMNWWLQQLPQEISADDAEKQDDVML